MPLSQSSAQKAFIGFDMGYGAYEMTENKQVLERQMLFNALQPHCVSNFPGYLFFRPHLQIEYQRINMGIAYTLKSTGSRYSLHDYSGDYKLDAQIVGHTISLFGETPVYAFKGFKCLLAAESGIIFNTMKINESFQLLDTYYEQEDYNLESTNIFLKPYVKVEYAIMKRINANIMVGYHKDLKAKKMHLENDGMSVSDFEANWDGIRSSLGISYRLN